MSKHAPDAEDEQSWLHVVDDVLDESVERDEAVTLTVEDLTVDVPIRFGEDAPKARWQFDGSVTVSADGHRGILAEWVRFWGRSNDSTLDERAKSSDETDGVAETDNVTSQTTRLE